MTIWDIVWLFLPNGLFLSPITSTKLRNTKSSVTIKLHLAEKLTFLPWSLSLVWESTGGSKPSSSKTSRGTPRSTSCFHRASIRARSCRTMRDINNFVFLGTLNLQLRYRFLEKWFIQLHNVRMYRWSWRICEHLTYCR